MSDQPANPFESPLSTEAVGAPPVLPPGAKRPASPMVFGILAIVFAAFGLLGAVVGVVMLFVMGNDPAQQEMMGQMGFTTGYMVFSYVTGFLVCVIELAAGIQLVRYKSSGLTLFNLYAAITVVLTIVNGVYTASMMSSMLPAGAGGGAEEAARIGGIIGGVVGALFSLIFPVLGLCFLNRRVVRESFA